MSHPASFLQKLFALFLMALAAACATGPGGGKGGSPHYKVGKPYKVNGKWYRPEEDPHYSKTGVASWYGSQFHGRLTANGEIFDMNRLSAAHTTLPLPSMVEVTNLENNRSILVRVNDRGPFAHGRIIDLSREAARRLGFEHQGTARVRVRYAGPAPLNGAAPKYASKPQRIARAAPVREETVKPSGGAPDGDAISELLTSMENAPALTPGAEKTAIAEAEGGAPDEVEIPAADLSTPAPEDARMVHSKAPAGAGLEALYLVRVAALSRLDHIDALRAQLGDLGTLRMSRVETDAGTVFYRVNLGPFSSIETAAKRLEAVRLAGYADAALVTLTP
ncbi:septal ring lytic transglycosylase RlpA family protein [Hyphococcus luteus]|uniref:Endolytic peptidoglycan transglycosylase RlpA n=1 Tax=Hyphococcus luteus TaxID=2058213 RepID=A0A2S7JYS5_9PROT|nr:septal ring lytic transglycosylase RlpA family protein [Marinicaulis flavus]PQA85366.1 septal ring lytic transglycosylase RlpA family protein [Marinicaulis flavus]